MSVRTDHPRGPTLAEAIGRGLDRILEADDAALIMGQDVGRIGGVFRVTRGLLDTYGADRVIDSPLCEGGLVGTAIGMAMNGARPLVEIQFDGFVYPALNQICGHLARIPSRLEEPAAAPVLIRLPFGGRIRAAEFHSESPEAHLAHAPDLRVVACWEPDSAAALLAALYREKAPAVFLEPKRLYRHRGPEGLQPVDADNFSASKIRVLRPGSDAVIFAYGPCVPDALEAAEWAATRGWDVRVVDLVSLAPLDEGGILEAAGETGRVVVVSEAIARCSVAATVTSLVATRAFDRLLAPPHLVAAPDHPPPPASVEEDYFPNASKVIQGLEEVMTWQRKP